MKLSVTRMLAIQIKNYYDYEVLARAYVVLSTYGAAVAHSPADQSVRIFAARQQ